MLPGAGARAGSEWGSGGDLPEGHPERHPAKGLSGSAGLELASSLEGHTRASSAGCRLGVTVLRRGSGHSSATLRASRPQANLVLSAKGQEERVLGHPSFTRWPCTRSPTPASVLPLALRFLLWPQNAPSPRGLPRPVRFVRAGPGLQALTCWRSARPSCAPSSQTRAGRHAGLLREQEDPTRETQDTPWPGRGSGSPFT